jgi:hypothetical protein
MIKRVSVLATYIRISSGPVLHLRPGMNPINLCCNSTDNKYAYTLSTETMVPKEYFSLTAAGEVSIDTLTQDENLDYYDLEQNITSDRFISITVRQFIVSPVFNLNKDIKTMGFCLIDLAF